VKEARSKKPVTCVIPFLPIGEDKDCFWNVTELKTRDQGKTLEFIDQEGIIRVFHGIPYRIEVYPKGHFKENQDD
jgi:hypothetical protein